MIQISRWKIGLVVAAVILGVLFALPNVLPPSARENLPPFLPKKTLSLGLDLQGGSYLLLEVDTEALQRERLSDLNEDVRQRMRADGVSASPRVVGERVVVTVNDPAQVDAAFSALRAITAPDSQGVVSWTAARDGATITLSPAPEAARAVATRAVDQSIEIVRRRIDELGTREPTIQRQGANRIIVAAPGESDPERLKNVIGQTAKLSFHAVDETGDVASAVNGGRVPPGSMLVTGDESGPILVRRRSIVTGEMLTDAQSTFDQNGQPAVAIRFNGEGARRFGSYTSANVGKSFAIVLDDKVISVANIIEPIPGGNGQISNMGSVERASDLAVLLRAGALPAPLNVESQRTIRAELGQDAVQAGLISTMVAFVCVLAFMVVAYGALFGGIAVLALLANGLLIIAAMSATGASLTLPGIAGLILTLAVAVDANVLIYERMRDEMRLGKSPVLAADAGFGRAMVTILDANITTLLAALIMFVAGGAGPVKGFAWTLTIGVFTSVFTAVLVTQVLIAWWFRAARPKTLPIV